MLAGKLRRHAHRDGFGIRCLSLPLEEELFRLALILKVSQAEITIRCLGWDGQGPGTLNVLAASHGITRERVRQIISKVSHLLADVPAWTPTLDDALELCEQACPASVERLAALLHEKRLARAPFHPHGLLTAAKVLGRSHRVSLALSGQTEWVVRGDQDTV